MYVSAMARLDIIVNRFTYFCTKNTYIFFRGLIFRHMHITSKTCKILAWRSKKSTSIFKRFNIKANIPTYNIVISLWV